MNLIFQTRNFKIQVQIKEFRGNGWAPLIEIGLTISQNLGMAAALPALTLIMPRTTDTQ
jgi:hypothetical protein